MHLTQFIHQKSYEHIVYQMRRHPVTFIPTLIGFLLLLAVPVVVYWLIGRVFPTLLEGSVSYPLVILAGSLFYLSVILFFYTYFITFYLDLLIVTNDRLLHIEQEGLFARTISELDLYQVQDVTSEVKGVFPSLFGYGNLLVQTAGAKEVFRMVDIPHPENLRQAILDLAEEDRKFHAQPKP
ncbi:MAG: hypothetical protein A2754_04205 [Candidatus Magasanikbacteria bacterium RIFCSPHIGHO2_01_FULL_47_8]|uniref:YdbS-like PH domain-containing protein n=1 Tax=Candidatus Magasanikbacteria bacterium RIFCSPHIGHO2_01_FULL_47_8 TaxID=1798673 RepID=A0A1F6MDJ8_9BACT|nr:MAG: hypothetical protein A2754_04205 [Candidatus Magasanikbacteria bacterium RIFCSPHIGHO2_01_FULL_47_8]